MAKSWTADEATRQCVRNCVFASSLATYRIAPSVAFTHVSTRTVRVIRSPEELLAAEPEIPDFVLLINKPYWESLTDDGRVQAVLSAFSSITPIRTPEGDLAKTHLGRVDFKVQ